ncbi:E3 ubiquitin-protein ligase RNF146 isoform X1 [Pogonomyrmex barbatus]|uniref:E3 ubiquitin-protein ligase n=1 Tax=Pogonomyrmex barbatus TaxID=144034 RepID=A0A6I9WKL8_9HYME|nr:E3 ubiquitin-protein ligase RNF146 isoform X1 [Pogonomyrmex barbatus]
MTARIAISMQERDNKVAITSGDCDKLRTPGHVINKQHGRRSRILTRRVLLFTNERLGRVDDTLTPSVAWSVLPWHRQRSTCRRNPAVLRRRTRTRIPRKRKGVANQSKRCPMCRQEIPPDFLERPQLVEIEEPQKESEHPEEEYQWFYEGRNGWWQYDQRTSIELETAYKQGKRTCELLIAGFLYIADFGSMLQLRRNDPSRRRRIKRDLYNVPRKGVAGLRLNVQDEEIVREIRGAERPASPASDSMGTGDGTNTPIPPSNTPQTPAGGTASGDATPLNDRIDQRSDSLHQVLEQMRSLVLREHLSLNSDNEFEEDTEDATISDHPTLS